MKRCSGIFTAIGLFCLVTSAAYSKSIGYDGKTVIGSGTSTSVTLAGTGSGCAGVLLESVDNQGCLPGITSLSFTPGYTAGSSNYTEIVSDGGNYTAFVYPPSVAPALEVGVGAVLAPTDFVAAVISGAAHGACGGSINANCFAVEFDYDSISSAGEFPVLTPSGSCPGGAASVSVVAGGVTSTYTSSNPCALNHSELDFVGNKLVATFCSSGSPCGAPTMSNGAASAPEMDSTSAISAMTLLAGCLAVFCGVTRPGRPRATMRVRVL